MMKNRLIGSSLCLFILLASWVKVPAQEKAGSSFQQGVLHVKMKDDSGYYVKDGQLYSVQGLLQDALAGAGRWKRGHKASAERLQELRKNAEKNLDKKLPDPSSEFRFYVKDDGQLQQAIKVLKAMPGVEYVLRIPMPVKPPVPDFEDRTFYKREGDAGINADSAKMIYGNSGAGINLCDIEYYFDEAHTDLPVIPIVDYFPIDPFEGAGMHHGTASLGVVSAQDNGFGMTGIAPSCEPYFAGEYFIDEMGDTIFDISEAIYIALDILSAGDVLMLEAQTGGPNTDETTYYTQKGYVPVEWYKPWYDAIVMAVGQGVHVVEAAGNGAENLDAPEYSVENYGHYPFLPENNSGAIIVGAGGNGDGVYGPDDYPRSILNYSTYGSRVDVQGIGESITTSGYGDLYSSEGLNNYYTAVFAGTSSSTAVVSGAITLVQSIFKEVKGGVLSPAQLLEIIKITGKPQEDGFYPVEGHNIGPLPNVYAAAQYAISNYSTALLSTKVPAVKMNLYPNPGKGYFSIATTALRENGGQIRITNVMGQVAKVLDIPASINPQFIDASSLPSGIYFVELVTKEGNAKQKMILTR